MRARVVRIGNSQGIRIPRPLLDQTGITDDVELEVEDSKIIIYPVSNPRAGWDNAFRAMTKQGEDVLLEGMEAFGNVG